MNKLPQTQSGIKRARTDQVRNYSDVLTSQKTHALNNIHQNGYRYTEENNNAPFEEDGSIQATENASPTGSIEETEIFVLDPTTVAWYIEPEEQAQYLMNFLQTQHCYGNTYVQGALVKMANGLQQRMLEMFHLNEKDRQQEEEINHLRIQNKGLADLNERLEKDNQSIPDLQVIAVELDLPFLTNSTLSRRIYSEIPRPTSKASSRNRGRSNRTPYEQTNSEQQTPFSRPTSPEPNSAYYFWRRRSKPCASNSKTESTRSRARRTPSRHSR
jgi:hypothetical protein